MQPCLLVVEVVGMGVVADVMVGAVVAVVGGEVVRGEAAWLWGALSDGPAAGHIL